MFFLGNRHPRRLKIAATHWYNKEKWIWLPNPTMGKPFPGQYFDAETGLHYNYFRDYVPGIGRYLQKDPLGFIGRQLNFYLYVEAKPLRLTDVLGLYIGQRFDTKAAAAIDAIRWVYANMPKSRIIEYCGLIKVTSNECYYATGPIPGTPVDQLRPGYLGECELPLTFGAVPGDVKGYWHTHTVYSPSFSPDDLLVADVYKLHAFAGNDKDEYHETIPPTEGDAPPSFPLDPNEVDMCPPDKCIIDSAPKG